MSEYLSFQEQQYCTVIGCGEARIEKITGKVAYITPTNRRTMPSWVPIESLRESTRPYESYRCDADGNRIEFE